jgi:hypothetical protein
MVKRFGGNVQQRLSFASIKATRLEANDAMGSTRLFAGTRLST